MDVSGASGSDRVYLSIITYPDGATHNDVASLLARGAGGARGMDEATLRMILRRTPPCIACLADRAAALAALNTLIARGGDGFAPSLADIETLGPTLRIRDLRLSVNGLEAELWRGPPAVIEPDDIEIIVRARQSEQVKTPGAPLTGQSSLTSYTRPGSSAVALGWGLGGAYGLAAGLYATGGFEIDVSPPEKSVVVHNKLDMHTADGQVFQIDGGKFAYKILGDQRGYSDNTNTDLLCELLTRLSPRAVVDPYFSYWRPPPGYQRLRLAQMKINQEDPAFAFYSRWSALMYRYVMGTT